MSQEEPESKLIQRNQNMIRMRQKKKQNHPKTTTTTTTTKKHTQGNIKQLPSRTERKGNNNPQNFNLVLVLWETIMTLYVLPHLILIRL